MVIGYNAKIEQPTAQMLFDFQFDAREVEEDLPKIDKDEAAVAKIVGERMKEGREICGYTINQAAALLEVDRNYLNRLELHNVQAISLKLIKRAAWVYDISTDFLLGLAGDEWEFCIEARASRDVTSFLLEDRIEMFSKWAAKQLRQQKCLDLLAGVVDFLRIEVASMYESLDRFRELNPSFNDMPGGSQLLYRIGKANKAAIRAQMKLIKAKVLPRPEALPEA